MNNISCHYRNYQLFYSLKLSNLLHQNWLPNFKIQFSQFLHFFNRILGHRLNQIVDLIYIFLSHKRKPKFYQFFHLTQHIPQCLSDSIINRCKGQSQFSQSHELTNFQAKFINGSSFLYLLILDFQFRYIFILIKSIQNLNNMS
ncbi:hypothetical protein FGO68_gene17015 [Halteria grandinella]|uniref:Uncharacterized protein n=1 Tax=Halteria grandinella TaxID=5974 RepID=A0A8J8SX49_HALGN|nr:hypothetical protein FGO68_gene17015 [Halteria grandinella]